jgi:hypothetical protein
MMRSFDFTIRSAKVDINLIKLFTKCAEKIRRCEYTGDILSGGNTFTSVRYSDKLHDEINKVDVSHLPQRRDDHLFLEVETSEGWMGIDKAKARILHLAA